LHCNYKIYDSNDLKYKKLENFIYNLIIKLEGSIAAEHGLGFRKNNLIKKYKTKEIYKVLSEMKLFFDKKKLLNKNKLIKT
jgi:FAD/FMN-containing dehydrogenase